ncbi:PAS domain-containing protein [Candidatus Odyssella thessalonicensis]|uniref:PAS domain-containing protein n=1 Tax=Candidatus Odyssella thessalonicensis TaxID=84647 RepID=UPI000225B922|nr:PAS domain-containing protein [Candidatus Odyssella thessalonicensis]
MALFNCIKICDAVVLLMDPLVEIVIHNIQSDTIVYINGLLSKRKVNDPSLLDKEGLNDVDKIVYPKINFDGRLVKSVSIILEEKWLLCINCDISIFSKMQDLSRILLQSNGGQPKSLFINDWQEKLHVTIHNYVQSHKLEYDHLSNTDKKAIAKHLFDSGAFKERNAADYIAKILKLGRATVFKYLKEWRAR